MKVGEDSDLREKKLIIAEIEDKDGDSRAGERGVSLGLVAPAVPGAENKSPSGKQWKLGMGSQIMVCLANLWGKEIVLPQERKRA